MMMNSSNALCLRYEGTVEDDGMSPFQGEKNDNSCRNEMEQSKSKCKMKLDGNGNMDEENDGVLLMVSCKNFLRNSQNNYTESNTQSTSTERQEEIPEQDSEEKISRENENIENNEDYEISTWSFSAENITDTGLKVDDENQIADISTSELGNRNEKYYCDGITSPCRQRLTESQTEPIHMTLEEVKSSLQRLYGKENSSSKTLGNTRTTVSKKGNGGGPFNQMKRKKYRKQNQNHEDEVNEKHQRNQRRSFPSSLKQTFCGWFKKGNSNSHNSAVNHSKSFEELSCGRIDDPNDLEQARTSNLLSTPSQSIPSLSPFANRALPPLPLKNSPVNNNPTSPDCESDECNVESAGPTDFTSSIHKVKDCGWYWGPISGEMAEKLLSNEPDGSFIVRDSSDERYIFSLTFKLNGLVRHVRIEHDQGNFSFGTFTNFRSHTIVGFIENAVQHSRSGRYLFFLHRRPVLGPMRVQLLHPVSRFKQVQSLQHMCRFVILKVVRRDLITTLPLPRRLKDYLNTPQYYTEEVENNIQSEVRIATPPVATTPEQNLLIGDNLDDESLIDSLR